LFILNRVKNMEEKIKLIKGDMKDLYMMLSFKGHYDIHHLQTRNPELYKEVMGNDTG